MKYTTFDNERVVIQFPTEVLVLAKVMNKENTAVAVCGGGFFTDYPMRDSFSHRVLWDNPEKFTTEFKEEVTNYLLENANARSLSE